jgi:hypothetical protein
MASENILKQCAFLVISAFSSYMFGSVTSSPDWLFLPLLRPSPNPRPSSLLKPLDGFGEISSINITLSLLSLSLSLSLMAPSNVLCLSRSPTSDYHSLPCRPTHQILDSCNVNLQVVHRIQLNKSRFRLSARFERRSTHRLPASRPEKASIASIVLFSYTSNQDWDALGLGLVSSPPPLMLLAWVIDAIMSKRSSIN